MIFFIFSRPKCFLAEQKLKSLKSHKRIPYTHRWESGNDTFQNMPHIFTGLENAFAGPGWTWKHHKSKDHKFLHSKLYPKKNLISEKNIFLLDQNIFRKKNDFFWSSKKYFFSELRFFFRYSFDVKISDLLIYDASRSIRARQTRFPAR